MGRQDAMSLLIFVPVAHGGGELLVKVGGGVPPGTCPGEGEYLRFEE